MRKMADYGWWQRALAGEKVGGPTLLVHDGDAQPGFWRRRESRGGPFRPVAIWEEDGKLVALDDGREADPAELWSFICRFAVSEEFYRQRVETGKWPDEDNAVAASLVPPPAGHNKPPTDPLEVLRESIDTALKGVEDYSKVTSDEAAAKAQSLRSRLLELSGTAEKEREQRKRPHFEAGKAVDEAWQPLVKMAKAGADAIRAAISAFETAQDKARKAAEAERQRLVQEAEKARLEAEAAGKPAPIPVQAPPPPVEPVKPQIRGAYGKAASKTVIKVAKVVDYDKAYLSLRTHPELKALIDQLAQRAVKAGVTVDGVEVEDQIDVR
jgi:bacterioferritin (cytochrome b1)